MTLDQFLDKLSQTPRTWRIDHGMIRSGHYTDEVYHCPISSVTGDPNDFGCARSAGETMLGLTPRDADAIFHAADDYPRRRRDVRARLLAADGHDNEETRSVRARLLAACGLPPEPVS